MRQFPVGTYRVDLVYPKENVLVECDEIITNTTILNMKRLVQSTLTKPFEVFGFVLILLRKNFTFSML